MFCRSEVERNVNQDMAPAPPLRHNSVTSHVIFSHDIWKIPMADSFFGFDTSLSVSYNEFLDNLGSHEVYNKLKSSCEMRLPACHTIAHCDNFVYFFDENAIVLQYIAILLLEDYLYNDLYQYIFVGLNKYVKILQNLTTRCTFIHVLTTTCLLRITIVFLNP